ncbi:MAG: hypothetical protein RLZZ283_776 [Candidatus Parcubacteria bacterium]|jgi:hypothetical protein
MKYLTYIVVAIVVLVAAFYAFNSYIYNEKQGDGLFTDYRSGVYQIGGETVTLGVGGATYFGNEIMGDIDGDGNEDVAFLITHDGGGSGTFYYLVGAINKGAGYLGTQAMLIGDRIAPQSTEFEKLPAPYGARVIVNYADRLPTDPMTAEPSVGKSIYAKYDPATNAFGEVVQDFEGESR